MLVGSLERRKEEENVFRLSTGSDGQLTETTAFLSAVLLRNMHTSI
jgi:hypothetical protein